MRVDLLEQRILVDLPSRVCAYHYIFDTVLPFSAHSQLLLLGAATVLSSTIVRVPL
jgi:hypothetical protein